MTTIKMYNGNNLIIPNSNQIQLNNGFTVAEQRGKKDMMWGTCIEGNMKGLKVLYPVYAADDLTGNFDSKYADGKYHVVKDEDIIMSIEESLK